MESILVNAMNGIWARRGFASSLSVRFDHFDKSPMSGAAGYGAQSTVASLPLLNKKALFADRTMAESAHHPRTVLVAVGAPPAWGDESTLWPALAKPSGGDSGVAIRPVFCAADVAAVLAAHPTPHVVQHYIDRPLLYAGHKIDFRCFVLLMPEERTAYLHWLGVGRVSGFEFTTLAADADMRVHLTNSAQQCSVERPRYLRDISLNDFIRAQAPALGAAMRASVRAAVGDMLKGYLRCAVPTKFAFDPFAIAGIDVLFDVHGFAFVLKCGANITFGIFPEQKTPNTDKQFVLADFLQIVASAGDSVPEGLTKIVV
jgi:hypothetical protein